jgi:hypothetical protein
MTENRNIRWPRQLLQRVDKVAADLNVVLLIFAVGLATLDFTFLVTQKVVERLPEVTRIVPEPINVTADAGTAAPQK